MFFHQLPNKKD
jgi:erythrocyte band 7 integral membrane protein